MEEERSTAIGATASYYPSSAHATNPSREIRPFSNNPPFVSLPAHLLGPVLQLLRIQKESS